jgi:hypothetical protein
MTSKKRPGLGIPVTILHVQLMPQSGLIQQQEIPTVTRRVVQKKCFTYFGGVNYLTVEQISCALRNLSNVLSG